MSKYYYFAFLLLIAVGSKALPTPDDGDGDDDSPASTEVPPTVTPEVTSSPSSSTTSASAPSSTSTSAPSTTLSSTTTIGSSSEGTTVAASSEASAKSDASTEPAVDLLKYRWDSDKSKYIRLGTTNECPANMRFFASRENKTAGQCDCDYYQCSRPLLYSPKTKECHFAWSRGPCEESEWFAFNTELEPVCEPRKCEQGLSEEPVTSQTVTLSYWFVDPKGDGKCHEAGSDETCDYEDQTLLLSPGDPIPKCRSSTVCVPLGRPEPQLCFKGNRKYAEGKCP